MRLFEKCPACGKKLNGQESQCPFCGLTGLDMLFLSKEDFLTWEKEVLNLFKETILPPRIFAGCAGVLILMNNGELYGCGNNDNGIFGKENYGINFLKPQLIAKNVKSAALGYNYTIYVTEEGRVELLGKSSIAYRERLVSITDADEVYASCEKDIFWVKYQNGEIGVWGNNLDGEIAPKIDKVLKNYERELEEFDKSVEKKKEIMYQTYGRSTIRNGSHRSWTVPDLEELKTEIRNLEDYSKFASEYGENNLRIVTFKGSELSKENTRKTVSRDNDWEKTEILKSKKLLCKMSLRLCNAYIYHPVPVMEDMYYEPGFVFHGSGLFECSELEEWGVSDYLKICYFKDDRSYIACLKKDGVLEIRRYEKNGAVFEVCRDAADISASESYLYIMQRDRTLLRISTLHLIEDKNLSKAIIISY